jgi:hypothetical protein
MLSSLAAPVAASSSLTFRGLKKILMDVMLAPQYEEYLISEPPTVESSMADCTAARIDCSNLLGSIRLKKLDISAIADAKKKEAGSEEDGKLTAIRVQRESEIKIMEDEYVRKSKLHSEMQKSRDLEMSEVERYNKLCTLIVPMLGRFKEVLLQSSTLGPADTQISVKMLFARLDNFIEKSEPVNVALVAIALAKLFADNAIPGLYSDIADRFQRFYADFCALRDKYAHAPTLLTLLSLEVFMGAVVEAIPRSEGSLAFIMHIREIDVPSHTTDNFEDTSVALSTWFADLLSVAARIGRHLPLAPSAKAVLATVAKSPPRRSGSGINLHAQSDADILAMTTKYATDVIGSCTCPVHGPDIGKHPLWLCNTFLLRLEKLPPAGKNVDFMALVAQNKASIDANRIKYAASSRDAPPK